MSTENPTGARGAVTQSTLHGGRKSKAGRYISPGEKVVLADIKGPGTLRHIWMVLPFGRPVLMRALRLEGFYDGMTEPSISVPVGDFFGQPHGRAAEFYSQLITAPEGRGGVNSYIPMPFGRSVRIELTNESDKNIAIAYQIDYTLEPLPPERTHYLHASFRRENPTTLRRDFVITEGLRGPGRFLGCVVGIRPTDKAATWYGEGEMKVYRDGDREHPTICGTGTEDYVGSAYGLLRHYGQYAGTPLALFPPGADQRPPLGLLAMACPDYVSFYRWHLPDPIMFSRDLRVTLQQIGVLPKFASEEELERYKATHPHLAANEGWLHDRLERQDDYCATAFVYCRTPQPVPRLNIDSAIANVARMPYEKLTPTEELILRSIDSMVGW